MWTAMNGIHVDWGTIVCVCVGGGGGGGRLSRNFGSCCFKPSQPHRLMSGLICTRKA